MRRDMDLVRFLLVATEEAEKPLTLFDLLDSDWSPDEIVYHVGLMSARGLLDASASVGASGKSSAVYIKGLTWDGCDYLDAIRDEGVWLRTKKLVKEAVGSTTMAVIKETACLVALQAIRAKAGVG